MLARLSAVARSVASGIGGEGRRAAVRHVGGLPEGDVVVAGLVGGLGNQMFQYAAARALALRTGARVAVDVSWFSTQTKQRYGLDAFAAPMTVVDASTGSHGRRLHVVKERGFHFQPDVVAQPPNCYLEGYWQSERYFVDHTATIRSDFDVPSPQLPPSVISRPDNAVSVHVRRGDYVSEPETLAYHGVCSLDYYRRAMDLVRALVGSPDFYVFSDDPDWAHEHLNGPDVLVVSEPGSSAHQDLLLMSRCAHHVLANSSFSWWGAWLSSAEGVTVAPRPWFLTPDNNTKDLLPGAWLTLGT